MKRRDILDMLVWRDEPSHGRLNRIAFLKRAWTLDEMPSLDPSYWTATQDIATHIAFRHGGDSYLHTAGLDLLSGPDEVFLRYVVATVHPLVACDEASSDGLDGERVIAEDLPGLDSRAIKKSNTRDR